MRTKADFRALRELVGMSQGDMADALDVQVLSVKRWERLTADRLESSGYRVRFAYPQAVSDD